MPLRWGHQCSYTVTRPVHRQGVAGFALLGCFLEVEFIMITTDIVSDNVMITVVAKHDPKFGSAIRQRICGLFKEKEDIAAEMNMEFDWLSEQAASVTDVLSAGTFRYNTTYSSLQKIIMVLCVVL